MTAPPPLTLRRHERLEAFLVALMLAGLMFIPGALGYAFARPGTEFMGTLMNPEDTNSYLAKMQQGYEGEWLYSIPFTSEAHSPAFLGGFYLLLGHAARVLGLSIIMTWYIARIVFTLLMFVTTYGFIRYFLTDSRTSWTAYFLAITGSGLGWVLLALGQTQWLGDTPVDLKMPEAHLFFSALTFPHFAAGVTLILASLWLSLRVFETKRMFFAFGAGLVNLALAIIYPFLIYLIALVLGLYWLNLCFTSKRLRLRSGIGAALSLLIPLPLLVYYLYVLRTNVVFQAWDAQAVTLSPNPLQYLVAYGAMLVLAAPSLRDPKLRPLWIWLMAVTALVYAPFSPQRRFVEGMQVPLSILAAAGLWSYYLPRLRAGVLFRRIASRPGYTEQGLERLAVTGLVAVLAVSNIYVLMSTSMTAALEQPYPFFQSRDEIEAIDWAGAHLPAQSVILSAYESGNLIPTRTSLRTVIGHWAETVDFQRKYSEVSTFFGAGVSDEWRDGFLLSQHAGYVFYGPPERALGDYNPALQPGLTCVYQNTAVKIFRVGE